MFWFLHTSTLTSLQLFLLYNVCLQMCFIIYPKKVTSLGNTGTGNGKVCVCVCVCYKSCGCMVKYFEKVACLIMWRMATTTV